MTATDAPVHVLGPLTAATDRGKVDDLTARTLNRPAEVVVGAVAQ